jgi:hypothetical protein
MQLATEWEFDADELEEQLGLPVCARCQYSSITVTQHTSLRVASKFNLVVSISV